METRKDVLGNTIKVGDNILTYRTTGRGARAELIEATITEFTPCNIRTNRGLKGGDVVLISRRNDKEC